MHRASPCLVLLVQLVLLAVSESTFGNQTAADPISTKLDNAKAVYTQKTERFRADLLNELDRREAQARAQGDKKVVDKVKADRASFAEGGRVPIDSVNTTTYESRMRLARSDLERAYATAIKELLRLKQDDRATALEKEFEAFRSKFDKAEGWVDLLAMVDVAKDGAAVRWTRDAGGLTVTAAKAWAALRVPYAPPDEYVVEAVLRRLGGNGDFEIGTIWQGRRFYVVLDYRGVSGLSFLDGKLAPNNETAFRRPLFQGTNEIKAVVTIRKSEHHRSFRWESNYSLLW